MNQFLIFFVVIAATAASVIKDPTAGYKKGDRYFYFPGDGDGIDHLVDSLEPVDKEFIKHITRDPANNRYYLYTRANSETPQELVFNDVDSVQDSLIDPTKPTVFLVHGWNGHKDNDMNKMFTEDDDVNVIVFDWSELADRSYPTAKDGVPAVGRGMGQFINWLVASGFASYETIHLVGYSLGGHVVGNAGRETSGKVRRITALDPAGPLWTLDRERIGPSDGQYVEIIHTNTDNLGYERECGDADFYPNGGTSMPGCLTSSCDHGMAKEYFAATVKYNHLEANECSSYTQVTYNRCRGSLYHMGNSDLNKQRTGIFRVNTKRRYPY